MAATECRADHVHVNVHDNELRPQLTIVVDVNVDVDAIGSAFGSGQRPPYVERLHHFGAKTSSAASGAGGSYHNHSQIRSGIVKRQCKESWLTR